MSSLSYKVLELLVKCSGIKQLCSKPENELREYLSKHQQKQKSTPPKYMYRKYYINEVPCKGSKYIIIEKKDTVSDCAVMFIHGGAWVMEINSFQWKVVDNLLRNTNAKVYIPIYLLAPQHKSIESLELVHECYKNLVENNICNKICILGDSAGAQISLSFIQNLQYTKLKKPDATILVSPPVTLCLDEELYNDMKLIEDKDVMLSISLLEVAADFWSGDLARDDYRVSPLNGDFKDLNKLYVFSGTNEVIYPQAIRLVEKARSSGVQVEFIEGEGMMHTWTHLPIAREGKEGLRKIIGIINK